MEKKEDEKPYEVIFDPSVGLRTTQNTESDDVGRYSEKRYGDLRIYSTEGTTVEWILVADPDYDKKKKEKEQERKKAERKKKKKDKSTGRPPSQT